jgi:hypothetical protein
MVNITPGGHSRQTAPVVVGSMIFGHTVLAHRPENLFRVSKAAFRAASRERQAGDLQEALAYRPLVLRSKQMIHIRSARYCTLAVLK